jgi:hypothetical protein
LFVINRLPISNIIKAIDAEIAIVPAIGSALWLSNKPITNDATAPNPNCIAPNNAAAVPALCAKGANDNAEALGLVVPTQPSTINIMKMVVPKPNQPFKVPITNIIVLLPKS